VKSGKYSGKYRQHDGGRHSDCACEVGYRVWGCRQPEVEVDQGFMEMSLCPPRQGIRIFEWYLLHLYYLCIRAVLATFNMPKGNHAVENSERALRMRSV
jgi:hypothetical protein